MAQTIGQTLQKKREQQGLSIADVAHDTRIHADTIRGLEADDYSVFASTTYARSFLLLYSRHLEVDADEALQDFASVARQLTKSGRVDLAPAAHNIEPGESILPREKSAPSSSYSNDRKQPFPLFLAVAVLFLLLIIPTFYFVGKKANSLEEAAAILKETVSSKEEGAASETQTSASKQNQTAPSLADQELSKHRFPRPLAESEPAPESEPPPKTKPPHPDLQLKATPITPKQAAPPKSKKTEN